MNRHPITSPRRIAAALAAVLVIAAGAALLLRHDGAAAATGVAPASSRPAPSPVAAVKALLGAEVRGDHEASFHLLSSAALRDLPDVESWARRRIEVPEITSFRVERAEADTVTVVADHEPGLDPFVGLATAHDRQRWRVRREGGGWLVDAEPRITPEVPDDAGAAASARRWAEAVQSCDQAAAERLQVESTLVGVSSGMRSLCHADGQVSASRARTVAPGPASADLVAQYGDDALVWARSSHVRAGGVELTVLLAPIGDAWRVVGVTDD